MLQFFGLSRKKVRSGCRYCQGLHDGGVRIPATELVRGSLVGCPACQLLYQSVSPVDLSDPRIVLAFVRFYGDAVTHTFDPGSEAASRQLCSEEGFFKGRWFAGPSYPPAASYAPVERVVELFRLEGSPSHWPTIGTARHTAAAADEPQCLELIRCWVSDCDRKHLGCRRTSPTVLPDRVVFVGSRPDPRLVELQGTRGKYVALSHRWGGRVSLQLRKDTIDDFKRRIPFSRLPKTFQDAINICRALAVDYIWIDSICIIQDSKEDWEIQGSKMDQVYANCLLTIAADAAENGDAGFIRTSERQALEKKTRTMVYRGPGGEKGELFVRPMRTFGSLGGFGRHFEAWEREDIQPSQRLMEQGSYLLRRGWVLQETFLPRRVLHFLPGEVSWRCTSASRCECKIGSHDNNKVVHEPLDGERPREIKTEDLREYWKEVIEQYTRRQLTFASDRLLALAGLASYAHSANPDVSYYAGLWSDTLPSTFLWTVDRPVHSDNTSHRIQPSIAPTWSWASITGYVTFLFWKRNFDRGAWAGSAPDLTNIRIHCVPSGHNKYGNVGDAKMTAEGYLCKIRVWLTGGSEWHFPFRMETEKPDGALGKSQGYFYPDTDEFLASLREKGESGMLMMVVSVYESRMFLALSQVGKDQLVFEREGVFYCEKFDAVILSEWGRKERITII
ncbi:HET-domain-containing protein [Hypoxylon sp. FL0543]|nr:HET-domain-containing protein [Hypoxylon sp. FL0543]